MRKFIELIELIKFIELKKQKSQVTDKRKMAAGKLANEWEQIRNQISTI